MILPSKHSKDPFERNLATYLGLKRTALQIKKGALVRHRHIPQFYESDQKLAEEQGLPDLFKISDLEYESNKMCVNVCEWIKSHSNKYPSQTSTDTVEKLYGKWLAHQRASRSGKGRGIFHELNQKTAEAYGYASLFTIKNIEAESNKMCVNVCEWIKSHSNKYPSQTSTDTVEKTYGQWVSDKRKKNRDKRIWGVFFRSDQNIANSYGYRDLFMIINWELKSNEMCIKVCEWKKAHGGKDPSQWSKDTEEEKYYTWLSNRRGAFSGRGNGKFYPSDQKIVEAYKYTNLFNKDK